MSSTGATGGTRSVDCLSTAAGHWRLVEGACALGSSQRDARKERVEEGAHGGVPELKRKQKNVSKLTNKNTENGTPVRLTYSVDKVESNVEDAEGRREQPDGDQSEQGKDDGPDEGQRDGENGHQNAVDPETDKGEEAKGKSVGTVKSLGSIRFADDVLKVDLRNISRRLV